MRFIGIDVGKHGGFAVFEDDEIRLYPYKDELTFVRNLKKEITKPFVIGIENVHASPRMGRSSAFSFGFSYGILRGVLYALGLEHEAIEPLKWQTALGCRSGGDKRLLLEKAKAVCIECMFGLPDNFSLATCDALLIAYYLRRKTK